MSSSGITTLGNKPTKKSLKEAIEDVGTSLQATLKFIAKEKTWVIIIGITGAGKTTLLYSLAGKKLISVRDEESGALCLGAEELWRSGDQPVEIGHEVESKTFVPNIWDDDERGIVFFDCPGFLDTVGERRLVNAFSIDQILANANNVKILLVVAQGELESRAIDARRSLDMLCKMIPNEEELMKSVGIVVTKVQHGRNSPGMLRRLGGSGGQCSRLINSIIEKNSVFTFREPIAAGSDAQMFEDREALFAFLGRELVANPHHETVVDPETQMMITQLSQSFNKDMQIALLCLARDIEEATNSLKNEQEMVEWIEDLDVLRDAAKMGWKVFDEHCQALSSKRPEITGSAQEISKISPWVEFMTRLMMTSYETSQMITDEDSPNSPLLFASREYNSFVENLKMKIQTGKSKRTIADMEKEIERIKNRPVQVIHHHHHSGGGCIVM